MQRRDALRLLGGSLAIPVLSSLTPRELLALGRAVHRRARAAAARVLDPHQLETVATIAELIIPTTDTPGARAAGVPGFIDLMLAEWFDAEDRDRFLAGLGEVHARSQRTFGRDFLSLAAAEQEAVLRGLDAEVAALREAKAEHEKHFFHRMKWLTVHGYYTSEIAVTQELKQPLVPGRYDPCVETGIRPQGGP